MSDEKIPEIDEEPYERYIPIEQSIIGSLKEMKLMQAGKLPKKTWRETWAEIQAEIAEEERAESNANNIHAAFQK